MTNFELLHGNCLEVLTTLPDNSIDSVVCDPPYGLSFMGKEFDSPQGFERSLSKDVEKAASSSTVAFQRFTEAWARECLRVLKPGGHLLAFGGSRTYHRMACAVEDAGFEIRDQIMWLYGCLSDDTELLIDGQWVAYDKAKEGDLTLSYDVTTDMYSWEPIQRVYRYAISDTAYRIQSASTDQIVSRNHRCLVEREGTLVSELAEDAARQFEARVPILEDVSGLLQAVPLPYQRASHQEQDVFSYMPNAQGEPTKALHTEGINAREGDNNPLSRLQETLSQAQLLVEEGQDSDMLQQMQWSSSRSGMEAARAQGAGGLDAGSGTVVPGKDDGREEPGMEGRRDLLSIPRELQGSQIRTLPTGIPGDGTEGRLCDGASVDCCPTDWPSTDTGGGGSPRYPQSTEQRPDNVDVISEQQRPQALRTSRYTRTDLARITPFHYSGIVWCIQVPTGAFVARRNGKVFVTGNSGFPKSLNVGKALDKKAGQAGAVTAYDTWDITAPATDAAKKWENFGTALKPAHEPVVVARKPLIGTVVQNVLEHGTGAINIDGCRVEGEDSTIRPSGVNKDVYGKDDRKGMLRGSGVGVGRWPANVILDEDAGAALDEQSGVSHYPRHKTKRSAAADDAVYGLGHSGNPEVTIGYSDSGGASRFFYCAKAAKKERGEGNNHPTVKPLSLMRWLVRLVTPPGGTVLDHLMGSGTTGVAALLEGFSFIGIEQNRDYLTIAERRITAAAEKIPA